MIQVKARKKETNPAAEPANKKEEHKMDENLNENKETLNTPEEEKETRWSRIRRVITPKRMKQAGAAVVLLAVLGVGGSAYTHYQHCIARAQAMKTRSNILSNLAAKENIQLISADQARQVVAEALGTDAASLKIDSVMLDTPGFGQDKRFKKDKDDGGRKEFREKAGARFDNGRREGRPVQFAKERRGDGPRAMEWERGRDNDNEEAYCGGWGPGYGRRGDGYGPCGGPWGDGYHRGYEGRRYRDDDRQEEAAPMPGSLKQAPEQAGPSAQAPGSTQAPAPKQGLASPDAPKGVTMADRQSLANRPLFYKVRCNTGNSEASFLVDARSGKILNTAVRPQKTFLAKLF